MIRELPKSGAPASSQQAIFHTRRSSPHSSANQSRKPGSSFRCIPRQTRHRPQAVLHHRSPSRPGMDHETTMVKQRKIPPKQWNKAGYKESPIIH
ncbi:hypothetical protein Nepgr_017988 [Nepenthes gracilis]|uniref:Uncharacterized protein n=1 Tax=Nepenthes gracilis TaxID=150966 RepID=A0AAD3SS75_NEPGR|nr:hypothetical protein Nepgr_017988 [Nepenthes gracilis]